MLLKANLTDAVFSLVKNTPKVTGFLGDSKPVPITEAEAQRILNQVQEGVERPKPSVTFEIGEAIRVSDGPFASFNGFVQEVDEERARLKVEVSIFGRAVPVDLEFDRSKRADPKTPRRFAGKEAARKRAAMNGWEANVALAGRANRTTRLQPPAFPDSGAGIRQRQERDG